MYALLDETLIQASRECLREVFARAVATANGKLRKYRIELSDADTGAFLDRVLSQREGWKQWVTPGRKGSYSVEAVCVAWWSDHLGRKHVRLVGRQSVTSGEDCLLGEEHDQHWPLRLLYPDHVIVERVGQTDSLRAFCACGTHGNPRSLGWMGPECGACHDRRESGEPLAAFWPGLTVSPPPRELPNVKETWIYNLPVSGDLAYFTIDRTSRFLTVGARSFSLRVWDLSSGVVVKELRNATAPFEAALSPNGDVLVATRRNESRLFWLDPFTFAELHTTELPEARRDGCHLLFSPDGSLLTVWWAGRVDIWEVASRVALREIRIPGYDLREVIWSPDGKCLFGAHWSAGVQVWDVATGAVLAECPAAEAVGIACHPQGDIVVFAAASKLRLWYWRSDTAPSVFSADGPPPSDPAFSPDGRRLAYSTGIWLNLRETAGWRLRKRLAWHRRVVHHASFSPDGRFLISADTGGDVRLWPMDAIAPP